ncbi:MAG: CPBP family intramembrane glutamic endopeptidase [Candidatus Dormibacteria bacterium]
MTLLPLLSDADMANAIFVAVITVVIVAILVFANYGERSHDAAAVAYALVGGLALLAGLVLPLLTVAAAATVAAPAGSAAAITGSVNLSHLTPRVFEGAAVQFLGGPLSILVLLRPVRERIAGRLGSFRAASPVHAVSLALYLIVLLYQLGSQVAIDQIKVLAQAGGSPSLLYIVSTNQLPMVIVSVFGMGLFVRRNLVQTLSSLGLRWPGLRWMGVGVGVALLLVLFGFGFDIAMGYLTPEQSKSIQETSNQLLKNVNTVGTVIGLGLAAGIAEEIFFRGALMPRIGNVASSVLFAALHTQYGLSLAALEIFILGLVLGELRRRAGTLPAIVAHGGYDIVVGLFSLVHP